MNFAEKLKALRKQFKLSQEQLAEKIGVGSGRGIGLMIIIAGLLLALTSILTYHLKSVRGLESRGALCTEES